MVKEKDNSTERLLRGAREFELVDEDGRSTRYFIVMPTAEEARQGQWEYTKAYNRALVEGVFTSNEMLDILKKRNIIGDAYDGHLEKLRLGIQEKVVELGLAETKEEKRAKAMEVAGLRDELFQWNNRFAGPMNNTAEQLATDARTDYFTSVLTRDENGNKIWESEKDYLSENNQILSVKARVEVMLWLEGLDSDMIENTPEQVALRELEEEELKAVVEDTPDEPVVLAEAVDPPPKNSEPEKTETKKRTTGRRKKGNT